MTMTLSGTLVFTGKQVDLHSYLLVFYIDIPVKDKGLFPLLVSPLQQQIPDVSVSLLFQVTMIQSKIDIHASDVRPVFSREKNFWNPASDQYNIIPVLSKEVHQFNQYGSCSLYGLGCVVLSAHH
ncbi:MAG: hypothetical protein ACC669_07660 [bacterium]